MTTLKKAVQVNYTADQVAAIIAEYKQGREEGLNNAVILEDLSAKYAKTVPSIRAKLAQVKAYITDKDTASKNTPTKAKKSDIVEGLETLTGLSLASFESVNKAELSALADYIDDMLETIHDLKARI